MHSRGRPIIGLFRDERRGRFAYAVAGLGVDADEDGRIAGLRRLQRRGKLIRMARNRAIVVIGGVDEGRRVLPARPQVVER